MSLKDYTDADLILLYRKNNDKSIKEVLCNRYKEYIYKYSKQIYFKINKVVDIDDLFNSGIIGLLNAINSYDIKYCKNNTFKTYAFIKIMSYIKDSIRNSGNVSSYVHRKRTRLKDLYDTLTIELDREPTEYEFYKRSNTNYNIFKRVMTAHGDFHKIPLDTTINSNYDFSIGNILMESVKVTPEYIYLEKEISVLLTNTITKLSDREKYVIESHYFKGLSINDIAKNLNRSACRISQIKAGALKKLKEELNNNKDNIFDTGHTKEFYNNLQKYI